MSLHQRRAPRTLMGVSAAAAAIALAVAGCSNNSPTNSSGAPTNPDSPYGFETAAQDAKSPITIWVDADRAKIAEAFKADHPEYTVNIETYDGNAGGTDSFHTKISLFDQAGEGWPDVVWSGQVNDASWAAKEMNGIQAFAAAINLGVVIQGFLDGYTAGALDPVTVDGHVYGARDNLAPVVFWYNQALFDEFGYDIPTTWEDYEALGDKLAAEHPGYILGSIGDPFTAVLSNMWSAQAPIYQVDGNTFKTDFADDHSTRMIDLMDHMYANKTLAPEGLFTPEFPAKYKDKVLGIPGPTWFTGGIIQNPGILDAAPGTWGAGTPLHWDGEDIATGNVGGGFWYGSSHSTNLEAVGSFLEYATSGPKSVELITGLPAHAPTASKWLDAQVASGYWANSDTFKAVVDRRSQQHLERLGRDPVLQLRACLGGDRGSGTCQRRDNQVGRPAVGRALQERRPSQRLRRREVRKDPISDIETTAPAAAPPQGRQQVSGKSLGRDQVQSRMAYAFSSGYMVLLLAFGIGPMLYALYLSFTKAGKFVGFDNFVNVFDDFRFKPAVIHVAAFVVIWVVTLIVFVVLLALVVHAIRVRWLSSTSRFLFYIPGALAGAASVMLWLFMLNPTVSPVSRLLTQLGFDKFRRGRGAGKPSRGLHCDRVLDWRRRMDHHHVRRAEQHPDEVMEAARIDGAGAGEDRAVHPAPVAAEVDRVHGASLSLAAGTQLFVEPRILSQATGAPSPKTIR